MSRKILSKRYPQITQMTQIETAKDLKNLRKSAKSVDEFLVHVEKTFLENYKRHLACLNSSATF